MTGQLGGIFSREIVQGFQDNTEFAAELIAAFNAKGYDIVAKPTLDLQPNGTSPLPDEVTSTPDGITPDQMAGWRAVNTVRSRANRANATPEQAAVQSQQATKRAAAWRGRMTPEEREAYNAKAAARMKRKRAAATEPHP